MKSKSYKLINVLIIAMLIFSLLPVTVNAESFTLYNHDGFVSNVLVNQNTAIEYQFQINHQLSPGDTINIKLADEFVVPNSINSNNIKIYLNDTEVVDGISNVEILDNKITLTINTVIELTDEISINILQDAGITNPSEHGSYTSELSTNLDYEPVSVAFEIKSVISEPLVSVYSNHVKKVGAYEIVFNTGNSNTSYLSGNEDDFISIEFPSDTVLPSNISNSMVTINGEKVNQDSILINGNTITIPMPSNLVIHKNSFVKIIISEDAGIINPSTASGGYTLKVWTSNDTLVKQSANYEIFDSIITVPTVTVSPNIINEKGAYFINFRTSNEGNLTANSDSIYILFPLDTELPANIDKQNILVNNVALNANPTISNDPAITNDPEGRYLLELKVPLNINANTNVKIQIKPGANIIHPGSEGNYSLEVWTSQDLVKNKSVEYLVAEAITGVTVWVSPDIAGQNGQYIVAVENGDKTLEVDDTITILFPSGTNLTNTNISDEVYIDGKPFDGTVEVLVNEKKIILTLASQINSNQLVNILFTQGAGIQNPLQQSNNYVVKIKTSKEIAYQSSNNYSILGNHILNLSTQLSNNGIGLYGEYLIQFTTSNNGGLLGGLDTITIIFPQGTILPNTISRSYIQVNEKPLTTNPIVSSTYRTITFTVPSDVNIAQGGSATINILSSANIKNPSTVGSYSLLAYTSRDPVAIKSNNYIIGKEISTPTVAISPNTYAEAAQYSINFYTSDQGGLASTNDYIEIMFPSGTSIPSSISTSKITINGKNARLVQVSGQNVKIYLPSGLYISNNGFVGITIDRGANIRNPVGGTYRLKVSTSKDESFVSSGSYYTYGTSGSSGTTPTTPDYNNDLEVELESNLINDYSNYLIKYTTSSVGALQGGIDEITITFSSKVELPSYISKETIKVNDIPINVGWVRISNQSIIFHLPTTLNVANNQTIVITIDEKAEIKNPSTAGTYSIYVSTSEDSREKDYYKIEGETSSSFEVTPLYNFSDQIIKYTFDYKTKYNEYLKGGYDWIKLTLPTTLTEQQVKDNLVIKVNGYTIKSDLYILSDKNLSFLLPVGVDVSRNTKMEIIIEDKNHLIMPNIDGSFRFYISTSDNDSMVASNELTAKKDEESPSIPDDTDSDNDNIQDNSSETEIILFLGKKEAFVNNTVTTLNTEPKVVNGTTMVPLRFITEVLGGDVDYRPDQKRIIILYEENYLLFIVGSKEVYTNEDVVQLSVAPTIENGTTLVPLRFISEWMGLYTYYDSTDKSITLTK